MVLIVFESSTEIDRKVIGSGSKSIRVHLNQLVQLERRVHQQAVVFLSSLQALPDLLNFRLRNTPQEASNLL